jgi:uncharacterized protein YbbC (DUF1343 family)/CubicO group peptidase (beta-lactamase class C family)
MWAMVLFAVAVYSVHAGGKGNVVEIGLSIASVAYGCLLGVFLLGTLTKFATQAGAIVGMVTGFAVNVMLWQWPGKVLWQGDLMNCPDEKNVDQHTVYLGHCTFDSLTVPHVAWTWYVLIGAAVTFAVGMGASVMLRKKVRVAVAAIVFVGLMLAGSAVAQTPPMRDTTAHEWGARFVGAGQSGNPRVDGKTVEPGAPGLVAGRYDFSAASGAIEKAISEKKLPGAVLVVGHGGKVVFEQAYGLRKYAGEPGIDGKPSPAEAMTVDTIFDMASLTKCLATATAVMQLVEQGKVDVDAPVVKYLPEFGVNGKEKVTVRELLTHYSGLPEDVSLKDAWGLAAPDKAEGIRRAMNSGLQSVPGTKFVYSDVNYITLGLIVEKVSGETLDVYAAGVFWPLRMWNTGFHGFDKACGWVSRRVGSAIEFDPPTFYPTFSPKASGTAETSGLALGCPGGAGNWSPYSNRTTAPTEHDDQGTAETNPDFDHLLRGTVHDPSTRRMGGVAGHAGVFSTADDVSKFAQALLDKLLRNTGPFPLKQATLKLMTRPEQPGTALGGATIFTADGKATTGVAARGFGWDINSAFSRPRGEVFPTTGGGLPPSFGHTGFTGTSLWMDPVSDTYVVLLANSVHPRGASPISPLRGEVAKDVAKALGLGGSNPRVDGEAVEPGAPGLGAVKTGIDVLEGDGFAELKAMAARHGGKLRLGLLTNQTGMDAAGRRTIDVLRALGAQGSVAAHPTHDDKAVMNGAPSIELVRLFSPEHGIFGGKDSEVIGQEVDAASGLKVTSLYGPKDADKRPKPEDLKDLDAVVIDLQDAGVRFYTYETVVGYFVEAAACERARGHEFGVVMLDRPALTGGDAVQGPVSDMAASYINYMAEPVRNGMTLGELAGYMQGEHSGCREEAGAKAPFSSEELISGLKAAAPSIQRAGILQSVVTVVKMEGWKRWEFFDTTGLQWVNPSPNLRSVEAATLYPGLGMMDYTNVSVGRGTATPFEVFGAAWMDGAKVAGYLTERKIPGVMFEATKFAVAETAEKYPGHGQTIGGVKMTVTDRVALDSPEMGVEILSTLHHLYPVDFKLEKAAGLVANSETMDGLRRGDDPRVIAKGWEAGLMEFGIKRKGYLLY